MKLSEYVKNYRTSHGLSLRAFAEKCGCSHQYLDKLEKDNIESPSFGQLMKIARAMGMTLHELIATIDDMEGTRTIIRGFIKSTFLYKSLYKTIDAWSEIHMHECAEKHKKRAPFLGLISALNW